MNEAETTARRRQARRRRTTAALIASAISVIPITAWATPTSGEPSVAMYTAVGLGAVIVVALLLGLALQLAHSFRLIGGGRRVRLARQLRVGFGGTFLLAAVTPYVALNFSPATLVPFLAGAGLVITAWVWGASGHSDFDSEISPPSEA